MFFTPVEAAGFEIAPEVKVRVTVDESGKVSEVEVLSIQPTSELDETFRNATIENIKTWRYAPAIQDGEVVAATLEWSVQYRAKSDPEESWPEGDDPFEADPQAWRRGAFSREARRRVLLERYANVAESKLDSAHRSRFDSPHFIVVTDAKQANTAEVIASNLEATYILLDSLFQPNIQPLPGGLKTPVYVFQHRTAFASAAIGLRVPGWGSGTYKAPGFLVFHLEVGTSENLLHSLIHEGFHAYSDSYLARPGLALPRWMEEGFAEYVANSRIKKGRLIPGEILRGEFKLRHGVGGAWRRTTRAGWSLKELKKAIRDGEAVSVEELLRTDGGIFYGPKGALYYPTSWLFVHFLRHGRDEWTDETFPALLLYLVESYPAREVLQALYSASLSELDAMFREYVTKL